jgi:hypothetical protein
VASSKPPSLIAVRVTVPEPDTGSRRLTEPDVAQVPPTGATLVSSAPAAWSNSSRALNVVGVAICGMAEMRPDASPIGCSSRQSMSMSSPATVLLARMRPFPALGAGGRLAQVDLAEVEQAPGALPGGADVDGGVAGVAAEVALGPLQRDADRPGVGRRDLDAGVDLEAADVREVVAAAVAWVDRIACHADASAVLRMTLDPAPDAPVGPAAIAEPPIAVRPSAS